MRWYKYLYVRWKLVLKHWLHNFQCKNYYICFLNQCPGALVNIFLIVKQACYKDQELNKHKIMITLGSTTCWFVKDIRNTTTDELLIVASLILMKHGKWEKDDKKLFTFGSSSTCTLYVLDTVQMERMGNMQYVRYNTLEIIAYIQCNG